MTDAAAPALDAISEPEGKTLLSWESRSRRLVTVYLPLICFLIVLLFPFYWMAITAFKPDAELLDYKNNNPFFIQHATLVNIQKLPSSSSSTTRASSRASRHRMVTIERPRR